MEIDVFKKIKDEIKKEKEFEKHQFTNNELLTVNAYLQDKKA